MIKYLELPGYSNRGEVISFSHFYQFMQKDVKPPITIILNAYEGDAKAFKGYLFHEKKTFQSIPLTLEEKQTLEPYVGAIAQVDLDVLVFGSIFESEINGYQKVGKE